MSSYPSSLTKREYICISECDQSIKPFKFKLQSKKKSIPSIHLDPKAKRISPAGNRTPVSRVTGGDTHHYTTEELDALNVSLMVYVTGKTSSITLKQNNYKILLTMRTMGTIYHGFLRGMFIKKHPPPPSARRKQKKTRFE